MNDIDHCLPCTFSITSLIRPVASLSPTAHKYDKTVDKLYFFSSHKALTWLISCCPLFLSAVPFPECRFLNFGKYILCLGIHFACHFDHFVLVSSEMHFLHLLVMDLRIAYGLREAGVNLLKVSLLDLQTEFHVWSLHVDETTHQSQGRSEMFWENQTLDPLAMDSFEFVAGIKQRRRQTMTPQLQNLARCWRRTWIHRLAEG